MNLKSMIGTAVFCVATLALGPVNAAIIQMEAHLDGSQEVPPNQSQATGFASVTLDDVTNLLSWNLSWTDDLLSGPAQAMHFHGPAPVGVNAGVQVNIGAISGITSPTIGSATITQAQADDLLAGLWYINIHTGEFPGGEIRGQVNVIPIPAAVWLFGSGLLGLVALARRRTA